MSTTKIPAAFQDCKEIQIFMPTKADPPDIQNDLPTMQPLMGEDENIVNGK